MIGRFAQAMLKKREDLAPLYRNAFAYNRRLAFTLDQMLSTSEERSALEAFSNQQGNFLAAVKYCDRFEADREELLDYLDDLLSLFIKICSLDRFIRKLSAKINIFQGKERQCAEAILLQAEYYNGDFSQAFAALQRLLPLDWISSLDRSILSKGVETKAIFTR
ncbi:MAG: hypothetical protein D3922_04450 [Candidatus Electrothrix sp. AR1]|nr:hypothetical protein [Candidatus Electrothrix sp. AR1]